MITPEQRDEVLGPLLEPHTMPSVVTTKGSASAAQVRMLEGLRLSAQGLSKRAASQWITLLLQRKTLNRAGPEQVLDLVQCGWLPDDEVRTMSFGRACAILRRGQRRPLHRTGAFPRRQFDPRPRTQLGS